MEEEANNLRPRPHTTNSNLGRPFSNDFTDLRSSTTSSGSTSPPDFLRHVQAAFKRHRPLGMMQSNNIRPRRTLMPRRETLKTADPQIDTKNSHDQISLSQRLRDCVTQPKSTISSTVEAQEDASITPPSEWGSTLNSQDGMFRPFNTHGDQLRSFNISRSNDTLASLVVGPELVPRVEGQKKVNFQIENNVRTQGVDDRMGIGTDNLSSYLDSLALTDMGWDMSNQGGVATALSQDLKHQTNQSADVEGSLISEGGMSATIARSIGFSNQMHHFTNFLQNESQPMTQSSVVGSSFPTTTLINSTSAPMHSSTTYCSQPQLASSSHIGVESLVGVETNSRPMDREDGSQLSGMASKYNGGVPTNQADIQVQASRSLAGTQMDVLKVDHSNIPHGSAPKNFDISKEPSRGDNSAKENITNTQPQACTEVPSSDVKSENFKLEKEEKGVTGKAVSTSRKKGYDPDLFFKVSGKLYQRLGKIGSGGSSEVHKVISSDCKIYALKKIKLKGRDYATAYGFYQEIEYLNKLKGKNNIIQLIDYEVTDKTFLREVINGSMSNKDGRVKEDGYIYMVLEYGEIDLAHMLSQKWKELDNSHSNNTIIGENWLRFYWQQILLAVNTIHEERIVHSDLKPANFLLVRGSLKLIDFGIAKAIMSDTTNIQRESQVGTLSYMSPEAFMCNETDEDGNMIKCGRPSDIWSLGCILYQMVYGRTPFSEYKTFWAKFKVITDPNHEITYEPLSNPWLLDIMKKCLAWDRNKRWRIPQLLQHPFLVPPVPPKISAPLDQSFELLHLIATSCGNDQMASMLCSQLRELLSDPRSSIQSQASLSRDQQCKVLLQMSNICIQLQEQLAKSGRDPAI